MPAMWALALAQGVVGARVGNGWRIGLGEEFLEGGRPLYLEFDEVVKLFVILICHSIDKSASVLRTRLVVSLEKGLVAST